MLGGITDKEESKEAKSRARSLAYPVDGSGVDGIDVHGLEQFTVNK